MKQFVHKKLVSKMFMGRLFMLLFVSVLSTAFVAAQTITGTVVDSKNEPLPGVSVSVKESPEIGTQTDLDGNFKLTLSSSKSTLIFSFIGFAKQEITVGNKTVINVILEEDQQMLEEVVVVGYGTMKKKDLTGAVGMINAAKLETDQPNTVQDLLRTGIPGMTMGVATDAKGNVDDILVRGKNSFGTSSSPLLVLDGVIYYGELTDISPNDIERIDVLKDASSAAVYGAKSANGVILITTKKGNSEKPIIRFSSTLGIAFRNSLPPTYKGEEYVNYRQAVMRAQNPGKETGYYDNPLYMNNIDLANWMGTDTGDPLDTWFTRLGFSSIETRNYRAGNIIDWERETYKTAFNQDYSISVSGRKNETSYYTSLNYLKNQSNVRGGGYSAIRARINLESKAAKIITYGINAQFSNRDQGYTQVSSTGYRTASPYGDMYDEKGNLTQYVNNNNNQTNPLLDAHYTDREFDINDLNASIYLKLDLPLGFSLQSTYAPRFMWSNERVHKSTEHPGWNHADAETAMRENKKQFYWQLDNMLKWNKDFGKHSFDFTFLLNWEKLQSWQDKTIAKGMQPSDVLGPHGMGWGTDWIVSSDDTYRTGDALMGRLHYSYDNRYMLTATYRRDGYSAFGANNPRANFPSIALGWVFSEEKFFPKQSWLDYGKFRLSWGKNGNREINMYEALMRLEPRKYYHVDYLSGELVNINSYYAYRMANSNLKWETTTAYNVGLDFGLINSRITGSLDVYNKKTTDLLVNRQLPDIIGYQSVMSNIGEVQNTGVELSLNSRNIDINNFSWNTTFGFSYNKNEIKKLYGLMTDIKGADGNVIGQKEADDITNKRFIGRSIDEIWDYKIQGVWQENEAEEAKKYGLSPGDFKLWDKDENGKYTNDDKVFQGSKTPKAMFSMRNSFTVFNNITFSFSLYSYLGQHRSFNRAKNDGALINTTNQIKTKFWTPENPINDYARLSSKSTTTFDVWRKSDFLRFDNISIGYKFPKSMLKRWKIEALNANLTMKNIGYISNWDGEDPQSDGNVPRTVYFGLNVTF